MSTFPHVRVVAAGHLGIEPTTTEIWSCGLKVGVAASGALNVLLAPSAGDVAEVTALALAGWGTLINKAMAGTSAGAGALFSSEVNLDTLKGSAVTAAGPDDPAIASVVMDADVADKGHAVAGLIPYTVALVATFRGTTWRRGAAALGRIYLPVPNLGVVAAGGTTTPLAGGRMNAGAAGIFATEVARLLDTINGGTLTSGRVPMVCNISTSAAESGLRFQNVSEVSVNTVPDTVRRRGNALPAGAARVIQTLPAP